MSGHENGQEGRSTFDVILLHLVNGNSQGEVMDRLWNEANHEQSINPSPRVYRWMAVMARLRLDFATNQGAEYRKWALVAAMLTEKAERLEEELYG